MSNASDEIDPDDQDREPGSHPTGAADEDSAPERDDQDAEPATDPEG